MSRKVPPEVQAVFDKYTVNYLRRLKKETALEMFQNEFELSPQRAELMFEMFDKDQNKILSIWEFYLFYTTFGYECNSMLDKIESLVVDGTDTLDVSELWEFLKSLKTLSGNSIEDCDLETCIMGTAGQERTIDRRKCFELVSRVKMLRH